MNEAYNQSHSSHRKNDNRDRSNSPSDEDNEPRSTRTVVKQRKPSDDRTGKKDTKSGVFSNDRGSDQHKPRAKPLYPQLDDASSSAHTSEKHRKKSPCKFYQPILL